MYVEGVGPTFFMTRTLDYLDGVYYYFQYLVSYVRIDNPIQ